MIMARTKRVYYQNAVYHVCLRGNNRQMVLKEESDKIEFLKTLSRFKERFLYKLFGFVLMDNHPHLVIEVNGIHNISKIMQAIALSYSQKFRHKYGYTGYVWNTSTITLSGPRWWIIRENTAGVVINSTKKALTPSVNS